MFQNMLQEIAGPGSWNGRAFGTNLKVGSSGPLLRHFVTKNVNLLRPKFENESLYRCKFY